MHMECSKVFLNSFFVVYIPISLTYIVTFKTIPNDNFLSNYQYKYILTSSEYG